MTPPRQGRNIAIVGASGTIGRHTLAALLSHGIHQVTAIIRPESTSTFPSGVSIKQGAFDNENFAVEALKNQDVLILQLPMDAPHLQEVFIRAAAKTGVKYILPTEFGSDPSAKLIEELPEIIAKRRFRRIIEELGVSSWIAVVNNPWYDYCLPMGDIIGVNVKERKATLWDGGNSPMNLSTTWRAGAAAAELVALPDDELTHYRNNCFYVSSFYITQRDILKSVILATGTKEEDWTIVEKSADEAIDEANAMTGVDPHVSMIAKFFPLHFKKGLGGDFNHKIEDLRRFGFEHEDLDQVTADVVVKCV